MSDVPDSEVHCEKPVIYRPHLPQASRRGVEARARKAAVFAANLLPIVRRIREAAPECGYQWIVDRLNEEGVPSPRGRAWCVSSLHAIMQRMGGLR